MLRVLIRNLVGSNHGAGIWGRGGPTIGANGRIYAATGDGRFDPAAGNYGSSVISASLDDLRVLDYYMPTNHRTVTRYDLDMGASSLVWFSVKDFNLVATGGKEGVLYMLDADDLGSKDHQTPLFTANWRMMSVRLRRKASGAASRPGEMRKNRPGFTFPSGDLSRQRRPSFP